MQTKFVSTNLNIERNGSFGTYKCENVTGVNPGGGGMGGIHPPTFLGGGDGLYKYPPPPPPLFEGKITSNLTFIVKKLTFLTVKLLKTPKIARSLRSLAHKCILRLDLCFFASILIASILFWHHSCKKRCRIKQTLCNSMARKSIAGLPIIQVKGTWRSQGGIILARTLNHQWLKSEILHWNIVVSYALSHLCISNNTSEIWYIKFLLNVLYTSSMM